MTAPLALVYGGSGSGKSAFAEEMLAARAARGERAVYIATMPPEGAEARERILRHRATRAHRGFLTLERYLDLASLEIPGGAAVLLECVGNCVANEMFAPGGAGEGAAEAVLAGAEALRRKARRVIAVSNDVGSDGGEYSPETLRYREILARVNRTLAARSAVVVETVCGIPLRHRDDGAWES